MTEFLAFVSALGPSLVALFTHVQSGKRDPEAEMAIARGIIRAAYNHRAETEIDETPSTKPDGAA